ncbi:hypothetical protein [uncultured Paraglaciecola sp.]|uniref:hypothetical protein n=1 Tax=uncultured Paraglaciecola sp. TaxID=1765024 RepID=UPI0026319CAC|nr:hypothetical protein [uncultured Paraglaciecola sp.]
MLLKNSPLPNGPEDEFGLRNFLNNVKDSFDTDTFTPTFTGVSNVTSSIGRWQRIGQLVYVAMEFEGTNIMIAATPATAYINLPIQPYIKQNKSTELILPSNQIIFSNKLGTFIIHGHQQAGTNRIVPDTMVTAASGLTVQGFYWTNDTK